MATPKITPGPLPKEEQIAQFFERPEPEPRKEKKPCECGLKPIHLVGLAFALYGVTRLGFDLKNFIGSFSKVADPE